MRRHRRLRRLRRKRRGVGGEQRGVGTARRSVGRRRKRTGRRAHPAVLRRPAGRLLLCTGTARATGTRSDPHTDSPAAPGDRAAAAAAEQPARGPSGPRTRETLPVASARARAEGARPVPLPQRAVPSGSASARRLRAGRAGAQVRPVPAAQQQPGAARHVAAAARGPGRARRGGAAVPRLRAGRPRRSRFVDGPVLRRRPTSDPSLPPAGDPRPARSPAAVRLDFLITSASQGASPCPNGSSSSSRSSSPVPS